MSAVDSAAPSIKPTVSALTPITVVKNTGSRLWIISEEISISMLTKPSAQMLRGIRFSVLGTDCEAESLAPPDIVSRKTGLPRQRCGFGTPETSKLTGMCRRTATCCRRYCVQMPHLGTREYRCTLQVRTAHFSSICAPEQLIPDSERRHAEYTAANSFFAVLPQLLLHLVRCDSG